MHKKSDNVSSLIFSLQNANKIRYEEKREIKEEKEFYALLKEETDNAKSSEKGKTEKLVHDEILAKEEKEKLREKLSKAILQNDFGITSFLNYLYQLVVKNPDALSLAEKQMIGYKDEADMKVGTMKLRDMLSARGLSLNDLNSKEVEKLMKLHDENRLAVYLDNLAREKKGVKTAAPSAEAKTDEKVNLGFEKVKAANEFKREEIIKQIIDQILIRNVGRRDKEIVIKMNPEYLGQLKVSLDIKDDKVTAKFETNSKEVRDIINASREELSAALKTQNLKLSSLSAELVENVI